MINSLAVRRQEMNEGVRVLVWLMWFGERDGISIAHLTASARVCDAFGPEHSLLLVSGLRKGLEKNCSVARDRASLPVCVHRELFSISTGISEHKNTDGGD